MLTTLPIPGTAQLAAMIVDANHEIIRIPPKPIYASTKASTPTISMTILLKRSCSFSDLKSISKISDVTENPTTDKNVEAEDNPAAMIPARTSVPTNLGITLNAAQIKTRCGSSRFGFRLITATDCKFKNSKKITVQIAAMAPERNVTCSLFAIRFLPACHGDTATVMNQTMPIVMEYIIAPNASLAPVPGMFP